jgi:uncharacterized membrane protein AbrB (regulator of aidB expression)
MNFFKQFNWGIYFAGLLFFGIIEVGTTHRWSGFAVYVLGWTIGTVIAHVVSSFSMPKSERKSDER